VSSLIKLRCGWAILGVVMAVSLSATVRAQPAPQSAAPAVEDMRAVMQTECASCHALPMRETLDGAGWTTVLSEHRSRVALEDEQWAALARYLNAAEPTDSQQSGLPILRGTRLGGYAQFMFENEEDKNSRFASLRFVMLLQSQLAPRLRAEAEVEIERGGSPEKRGGELVAGEVLLEQAILDFEIFKWLVARAGVLLVPFGHFNQRHDAPVQEMADRPISDTLVIPTTWFEAGAGAWGDIHITGDHQLHYQIYAINGLDTKLTDDLGTRGARGSLFEDNNNDKALTAQLRYTPHPILDVGASLYTGDYDLKDNRIWMFGGDAIVALGNFGFRFSYAKLMADPGFVEGFPEGSTANTRKAVPTGMNGVFGEVRYRLPLRAIMPDDLQSASLGIASRYTQVDTNEDVMSAGDRADLALGMNFRPVLPAVIKAEVHWLRNGAAGDDPSLFADFFDQAPTLRFVSSVAYSF